MRKIILLVILLLSLSISAFCGNNKYKFYDINSVKIAEKFLKSKEFDLSLLRNKFQGFVDRDCSDITDKVARNTIVDTLFVQFARLTVNKNISPANHTIKVVAIMTVDDLKVWALHSYLRGNDFVHTLFMNRKYVRKYDYPEFYTDINLFKYNNASVIVTNENRPSSYGKIHLYNADSIRRLTEELNYDGILIDISNSLIEIEKNSKKSVYTLENYQLMLLDFVTADSLLVAGKYDEAYDLYKASREESDCESYVKMMSCLYKTGQYKKLYEMALHFLGFSCYDEYVSNRFLIAKAINEGTLLAPFELKKTKIRYKEKSYRGELLRKYEDFPEIVRSVPGDTITALNDLTYGYTPVNHKGEECHLYFKNKQIFLYNSSEDILISTWNSEYPIECIAFHDSLLAIGYQVEKSKAIFKPEIKICNISNQETFTLIELPHGYEYNRSVFYSNGYSLAEISFDDIEKDGIQELAAVFYSFSADEGYRETLGFYINQENEWTIKADYPQFIDYITYNEADLNENGVP